MDGEKFEGHIQEAIGSEPLKAFGFKLLGIGADKMVFETPGSDRKIIKVNISGVISQVLGLLDVKTPRKFEDDIRQTISEHEKIEDDLREIFGQEHLLRSGVFKVKIPITKDILSKVLSDIEDDEGLRKAVDKLDTDTILEVETLAETQIKAKELIEPEKFKTVDFSTDLIIWNEFRDAGEVSKALERAKEFVDRNFLSAYDGDSLNPKYIEATKEIVTKIIRFTKKTGLMMDVFGLNNITIFTREDGVVDYHLLDVILPGRQKYWVKNIKDDPGFDLLRHYYIFYYSIKSLADKLKLPDNLLPEDLVYFKDVGIPTEGRIPEEK